MAQRNEDKSIVGFHLFTGFIDNRRKYQNIPKKLQKYSFVLIDSDSSVRCKVDLIIIYICILSHAHCFVAPAGNVM